MFIILNYPSTVSGRNKNPKFHSSTILTVDPVDRAEGGWDMTGGVVIVGHGCLGTRRLPKTRSKQVTVHMKTHL